MSGQDLDSVEEFQSVFEEVGEVMNILDVVKEVADNEDINTQHCDGGLKKCTKYH